MNMIPLYDLAVERVRDTASASKLKHLCIIITMLMLVACSIIETIAWLLSSYHTPISQLLPQYRLRQFPTKLLQLLVLRLLTNIHDRCSGARDESLVSFAGFSGES